MKTFLAAFLLLFSAPSLAQKDSLHVIDSLKDHIEILESELRSATASMRAFATMASNGTNTYVDARKDTHESGLEPYLDLGMYGQAHTNAEPYAGLGIEYNSGHFGITATGRMQFFSGEPPDPSIGIILPQKAQWQAVFEGEILIYLY